MGLLSIVNRFFIYMPTLMLTRFEIKMILLLLAHSLYTLVAIQFLGVPRNNPQLRSSTKAEYRSVDATATNLCWISNLLGELSFSSTQKPIIYCDNVSATNLCSNPMFHSRMKHVALDYHFIRKQVQNSDLHVTHVASVDQLVNALTKHLPRIRFHQLLLKIGLSSRSSNLRVHIGETESKFD